MSVFSILQYISVPNRDDGSHFTDTQRIEKITSLLWNTRYRRCNPDGLFFLFSVKPIEEMYNPVLISSHIDCVPEMTRLFAQDYNESLLSGTFDNSITNAAVLHLMVNGQLNDDVIVAFTGDEEHDSTGAVQTILYLTERSIRPRATIILDVTDMGWDSGSLFTLENNFWGEELGRKVVDIVQKDYDSWKFVPSDPYDIPKYIDSHYVIDSEAEPDESWDYDEFCYECFSLCLPTFGPMHSNRGILARKDGLKEYVEVLKKIANNI